MKNVRATAPTGAVESEPCTSGPGTEGDAFCSQHSRHEASTTSTTSRARARRTFIGLLLAAATVAVALLVPAVAQADNNPSWTTGKADYAPGEVVDLSGIGYTQDQKYSVPVKRPNGDIVVIDPATHAPLGPSPMWEWSTADLAGNLSYNYQLDGVLGLYTARVYPADWNGDWNQTPIAETTFTDAPASAGLDQCENGGVGLTPEPCKGSNALAVGGFKNWGGGNSNSSKSHWTEDEFIPYRAVVTNVTAGTHTLTIVYDTVHSSVHAFDYLGSFDATETTGAATALHANSNNPCADILTGSLASQCTPATPTGKLVIPSPTLANCGGSAGTAPSMITGSDPNGERAMKIWGPASTNVTAMTYLSENAVSGTGQCSTTLKISFTVGGAAPANTVVLAWSAHIARGAGANGWGAGNGAGNVGGSPYHMAFDTNTADKGLDGATQGSQDHQMQAGAVIPASTITIVKNTVGGNDTFAYTTTGGGGLPAGFNITTVNGTGQQVNPGINPGTYTVTESTPPTGWTFQPPITCTSSGGATTTPNGATVSITIPATGGAAVTCTYVNSLSTKPNIATELHNNNGGGIVANGTHLPLGSSLYDVATLSDSGNPFTGTVTFKLWKGPFTNGDCTTGTVQTTEASVAVSGTTATSSPTAALGAGDYAFTAQYIAGSDTHHTNSDLSACEPFTIDKAQLTMDSAVHNAAHVDKTNGNVPLGSVMHDTGKITDGLVTGLSPAPITFTFYANGTCDGAGTSVSNTGADEVATTRDRSAASAALAAGSYSYKAFVATNGNYLGSDSGCEPFTVDKAQLTMDSAVHNAAHVDKTNGNVPLGSVMHDTGKITDGLVTGLSPAPITFTFYANGTCDGAGTSVSNTGADEVATTRDRSAASAALAAGSYSYKAFVATNGNYLGSDSGCEPFTVDKAQLTMDSAVHNAAHVDKTNGNVPLGSVMHDTGKITDGLVTGLSPAPITFTFYANGTCDGAGTSVSNTGADEVATTRDRSAASAALAAGSYSYKAFVATNGNYLGSDSGCEPFTVDKAQLTMDSAVHNAAHVDKTNGNVPLGSVMHDTGKITDGLVTGLSPAPITFTFYANGTCDGAGTSVSNTGADEVATTRDRSAASAALAAGSYSYKAFVATNGNYLGSDSGCEPFTVDKAQLTMDSAVHNAAHVDKTNGNVPLGSVMHDTGKITDGS